MITIVKEDRIRNSEVNMYIVDFLHNGIRLCAVYDFDDPVIPYQLHGGYRLADPDKHSVFKQIGDFIYQRIGVRV